MRTLPLLPARAFASASLAILAMIAAPAAAFPKESSPPLVTLQPDPPPDVMPYFRDWAKENAPQLTRDQIIARLRAAIKYVFVIYNENESFDHYFGTFPGANGLYSDGRHPRAAKDTPGFTQTYKRSASGETVAVEPFRIGLEENADATDSVDHSRIGLLHKLHIAKHQAAMDQFARGEYERYAVRGGAGNEATGTQLARLVMSYIDCDTIPFLWQYASRFVLFDNMFATVLAPSTPNAIAIIAGQSGETQWVRSAASGKSQLESNPLGVAAEMPLTGDPEPFYGSQFDSAQAERQPAGRREHYERNEIAQSLGFASLPLTLLGREVKAAMRQAGAGEDLAGIEQDIEFIARLNGTPAAWRWYEEGYGREPTDQGRASHEGFVSHHEAPQYFGYLANNPALRGNFRSLGDFFTDIANKSLPPEGGVFFIRGGYLNIHGDEPYVHPATSAAKANKIREKMKGDDGHPGYSTQQISEAMNARVINAIASDEEIWKQSVIIITYDESDGFYDHVPPRILSYGPDGLPLSRGPRVPVIVISPYVRVHAVSHAEGDHNAVIQTVNAIFGLPALASLPAEAQALAAGRAPAFNGPGGFEQRYLGPRDLNAPITDDLLSAFDPERLLGLVPPLHGNYAMIPEETVNSFPHYGGQGCAALGMTPEDRRQGIKTAVPPGFNALPLTFPSGN